MADFFSRLKQRKIVQWALAYLAASWVVLQVLSLAAGSYHWPDAVMHIAFGVLAVGFVVVLVLAWYHGERGVQRVSGVELLLIALVLAVGGGVLWQFARTPAASPTAVAVMARSYNPPTCGSGPCPRSVSETPDRSPAAQGSSATRQQAPAEVAFSRPNPIPAKSIAVLPFENLSSDKQNDYFVAGMQDLILTKLADIGDLKVISRTSTIQYGAHPQNLTLVGQQLGVATILEGSVQKQGDQVLINVQLIDARTDAHIWAQTYRRTLNDVFGVEGEVAGKVATSLQARLSPQETRQLATALSGNPAANDLYLAAESFPRPGGLMQWKQALPLYRKALALAPDFALARARLSYVESSLAWFGGAGEDVKQLQADARAQAARAIELAPNLPEAHLALGYCDYYGKGDYAAAYAAFSAVVKLRPNDADALTAQGAVLRRLGRFDAAIASFRQAVALNPRDTNLGRLLGTTYALVSRWPDAEAAYRRVLQLDPGNGAASAWLATVLVLSRGDIPSALTMAPDAGGRVNLLTLQRKYRDALALLDKIADTKGNGAFLLSPKALRQARLHGLLGETAQARALYAKALPEARSMLAAAGGVTSYEAFAWINIAETEFGLGDTDQALAAMTKARALIAKANDHVYGPSLIERSAAVYAMAGRADAAVPLLARALASPGIGWSYSPVMLWLDPAWDPIRGDSQFQALLKRYAKYKPAVIPAVSATSSGNTYG